MQLHPFTPSDLSLQRLYKSLDKVVTFRLTGDSVGLLRVSLKYLVNFIILSGSNNWYLQLLSIECIKTP